LQRQQKNYDILEVFPMTSEEKVAMLERKLKTLQMFYAAVLADSTLHYGNAGILDRVTEQKHAEQMKTGTASAERLGIKEPKQTFLKTQDTFGCANWVCEDTKNGFSATCVNCMLCAMSKKMGQYSPCLLHCLNPIEAMLKGIAPNAEFIVDKTMWDDDKCAVRVILKG